MLFHAVAINKAKGARAELVDEPDNERALMAKYRRQSLWLLVPLIVPFIALTGTRNTTLR